MEGQTNSSERPEACRKAHESILRRELGFKTEKEERDSLARHLEECPDCRKLSAEERAVSEMLLRHAERGDQRCEGMAARIAVALPERIAAPWWFRPSVRAAAAVLLFAAGVFVGTLLRSRGRLEESAGGSTVKALPTVAAHSTVPLALPACWTSGRDRLVHRVLPGARVITVGKRHFSLFNPERPDVRIEVDYESRVQDVLYEPEVR